MSDSLADILGSRSYNEPPEVEIIKKFVRQKFNSNVGVKVQERQIVISVSGSALAGSLRFHLHELKELCKTDKRLSIQIK